MQHKIVTIIQARTGSSRLPAKVLLPLAGAPALLRQVERVQRAQLAGKVVIATSTAAEDDAIVDLSRNAGVDCFRGDMNDLLDRHYRAGQEFDAETVVKIPSDCPLIDPAIIDQVLRFYLRHRQEYDFVSNLHPPSWPDGNDVEVMPMPMLALAWREARRGHEREHTTPFFWDNPARFRIGNVRWETGFDYSMSHRWTLDYEEDYRMLSAVYDALYPLDPAFTLKDILDLLKRRPALAALNDRYAGVNWYRNHLDELQTVSSDQTNAPKVTEYDEHYGQTARPGQR